MPGCRKPSGTTCGSAPARLPSIGRRAPRSSRLSAARRGVPRSRRCRRRPPGCWRPWLQRRQRGGPHRPPPGPRGVGGCPCGLARGGAFPVAPDCAARRALSGLVGSLGLGGAGARGYGLMMFVRGLRRPCRGWYPLGSLGPAPQDAPGGSLGAVDWALNRAADEAARGAAARHVPAMLPKQLAADLRPRAMRG